MSVFCFICWYFPIGLYRNARWTGAEHARGANVFLLVWLFFVFTSTFAHMIIAAIDSAEVAGGIVNLFLVMMFAFCGVLAGPNELPRFWIFMYRINPFTYVVEGFLGSALANAPVHCASNELLIFERPDNATCKEYMQPYIDAAGGFLTSSNGGECSFCPMDDTNVFLEGINVDFANRWRDFGFLWAYCIFNIAVAIGLYWLVRVPKPKKQ